MPSEATDNTARLERSLSTGVYEWLRERIIDGSIKPGDRIREREVAEDLQVSRIPVREALPQLEGEGYIQTIPHRGAVVTHMTVQDVTELFDVRSSLEILAARLAAQACAAGASPAALQATLEEASEAVAEGDGSHIADVNSRLHDEILALSGNRLLQKLMAPVSGHVRRLFHIATDRDQGVLHAEHVALVQAILQGQTELACALAFAHVEHSRNECLPIVERLLQ